jgi:membrane protein
MLIILPVRLFNFIRDVIKNLHTARASYLAASIAYFIVMSLVPFLLLIISVSGFVAHGSESEFGSHILRLIHSNSPILQDSIQKYVEFATKHKHLLGLLGVLALLWTSKGVVFSLNFGLDRVMMATDKKPYLRRWLDTVIMLVIMILLFSFSLCLMIATSYINALPIAGDIAQSVWRSMGGLLPQLVSLAISLVLFYSIYRIIPVERPGHRPAFIGALIGATIWQIVNGGFSWYLTKQTVYYQVIYGSVAALIYIILWAYLLALSVLIGGAVSKVAQEKWL